MDFRGVALIGNKSAGKSTVTRHLVRRYLLRSVHVKTLFSSMVTPLLLRMGVPMDEVAERCFGDRINEPLPDPWDVLTTRRLLQAAGGGFLEDLGIEGIAHDLTLPSERVRVIIESVRRPEEAEFLRTRGFALVRIDRPSLGPPTYEHVTEVDLTGVRADAVLTNDGTLDDLTHGAEAVVESLMGIQPRLYRNVALILNGRPTSGKDTITYMLGRRAQEHGVAFQYYSSIEPVREILKHLPGLDVSRKTPEDRDLMAAMKGALEKHSLWCTGEVVRRAADLIQSADAEANGSLFVTHVREAEGIRNLRQSLMRLTNRPHVLTGWVARPGCPDVGATNAGDQASISEYPYDVLIRNERGIEELDRSSDAIFRELF